MTISKIYRRMCPKSALKIVYLMPFEQKTTSNSNKMQYFGPLCSILTGLLFLFGLCSDKQTCNKKC